MVLVRVVALTLIPTRDRLSCWTGRETPQLPGGESMHVGRLVAITVTTSPMQSSKQLLQQGWRTARTSRVEFHNRNGLQAFENRG